MKIQLGDTDEIIRDRLENCSIFFSKLSKFFQIFLLNSLVDNMYNYLEIDPKTEIS